MRSIDLIRGIILFHLRVVGILILSVGVVVVEIVTVRVSVEILRRMVLLLLAVP